MKVEKHEKCVVVSSYCGINVTVGSDQGAASLTVMAKLLRPRHFYLMTSDVQHHRHRHQIRLQPSF